VRAVVDASWLAEHLGEEDFVVGDVRGPNAHMRGHIPGSRPLVLGSPPPAADQESARALAQEIALRLRRHGITGRERLVLVDRGDGVGAMPAAQMAELAGHPQVAILLGGIAAWDGELQEGAVELEPVREAEADLAPNPGALPTRQELAGRLGDPSLTLLDVRTPDEYSGRRGNNCDPRQGHIPGARLLEVGELFDRPGQPASPERIRELVGLPEDAEIVAYCHSGSRSALATLALRFAGYDARNYAGSWHEWSRHDELPLER
jgi:thiosulfate/3-mercaptopyruvate sulfurtransferase